MDEPVIEKDVEPSVESSTEPAVSTHRLPVGGRRDRIRRLAERFVAEVRPLHQVQQVLLDRSGRTPRIWTVIEAEPFDWEQRRPIYDAQLAAIEDRPDAIVDFELVNLAECGDTGAGEVLPPDAGVLWQR